MSVPSAVHALSVTWIRYLFPLLFLAWMSPLPAHAQERASSAATDVVAARVLRLDGLVWASRIGDSSRRALRIGSPVHPGERVATGDGSATLRFFDGSRVEVGPLAEFVIDAGTVPDRAAGRLEARFQLGKSRFRSGSLAREAYRLETPLAVIGIRGTYFEVSVDGFGVSEIRLLQDDLDGSVGEIVVSTISGVGFQILDSAGETTRVTSPDVPPSAPNILDLGLRRPGGGDETGAPGEAQDAQAAVAEADDVLARAVRELQQDLLATNLLDSDPLSLDVNDSLSTEGLLRAELDSDFEASGARRSSGEAEIEASGSAVTTDSEGAALKTVAQETATGAPAVVSIPEGGETSVVIDSQATVESAIAEAASSNVIVVIPTP